MNCWHCNTELAFNGEHDTEDEDSDYSMITNLSCPKCHSIVDVYYPSDETIKEYEDYDQEQ